MNIHMVHMVYTEAKVDRAEFEFPDEATCPYFYPFILIDPSLC